MNLKWFITALFAVLALLGVGLEKTTTPNQEIVVQFDDHHVDLNKTQNAIALVKEQLQSMGAENIRVHKSADGQLKITYYSEIDVANVRKLLSDGEVLSLGYVSYTNQEGSDHDPVTYDLSSYQLNVSEIQDSQELVSDHTAFLLESEFKIANYRYFNADFYFVSNTTVDSTKQNQLEKVAYQVYAFNALFIDNSSHNIPEVRAGPVA